MFIGYGCYEFKPLMATIHRRFPKFDIIYFGEVNIDTIEDVLKSDQVDIYLCGGAKQEPYLTYDLHEQFRGKILNLSNFFNGNKLDEDRFITELTLLVNQINGE